MAHDYELYNLKKDKLKEDLITIIVDLLKKCDDVSLLDLIKKLLDKSV